MKIDTSSHSLPLVITTELTEAEHRFENLKSENLVFYLYFIKREANITLDQNLKKQLTC